jgi:hypothetical protein
MTTTVRFILPQRRSKPRPKLQPRNAARRGDRTARMLALGYVLEQAMEDGRVRDLAHAAALFGLTRARMTQVAALANLAPDVQERVLGGDTSIHERKLRAALRFVDWNQQRAALQER